MYVCVLHQLTWSVIGSLPNKSPNTASHKLVIGNYRDAPACRVGHGEWCFSYELEKMLLKKTHQYGSSTALAGGGSNTPDTDRGSSVSSLAWVRWVMRTSVLSRSLLAACLPLTNGAHWRCCGMFQCVLGQASTVGMWWFCFVRDQELPAWTQRSLRNDRRVAMIWNASLPSELWCRGFGGILSNTSNSGSIETETETEPASQQNVLGKLPQLLTES